MNAVRGLTDVLSSVIPGAAGTPAGEGAIPAGGTGGESFGTRPREEAALRRSRAVSHLLDEAVRVPGTDFRVGLDPILGVLPVAGDSVATVISLYPILEAYRLDVPRRTLTRMALRVALDSIIGSIPILGTLFDAGWKANARNVRTLEKHVKQP